MVELVKQITKHFYRVTHDCRVTHHFYRLPFVGLVHPPAAIRNPVSAHPGPARSTGAPVAFAPQLLGCAGGREGSADATHGAEPVERNGWVVVDD